MGNGNAAGPFGLDLVEPASNPSWGTGTHASWLVTTPQGDFQPLMGTGTAYAITGLGSEINLPGNGNSDSRALPAGKPMSSNPSWGTETTGGSVQRAGTACFQPLMGNGNTEVDPDCETAGAAS